MSASQTFTRSESEILGELHMILETIKQINSTLEKAVNLTAESGRLSKAQQRAKEGLEAWRQVLEGDDMDED
ncbi:uncharacterized protein VTP21DRAFT_5149 [Calcarisporiella thermophila]|uniref:uncharacterized protein n=1 Tax=Calcarisporiella thermophila TaxID=911321 RepID=UPI00374468BA